ncbi:MAG: hypothetical protein HQK75_01635, partial [Candidatus Magnetomorum sp.]|nr:hypothetical protein [Candidatus Magnetomorum sp.]
MLETLHSQTNSVEYSLPPGYGPVYSPSKRNSRSKTKKPQSQKWTMDDIQAHQRKMYSGEIEWEELWEVPGKYSAHEY